MAFEEQDRQRPHLEPSEGTAVRRQPKAWEFELRISNQPGRDRIVKPSDPRTVLVDADEVHRTLASLRFTRTR